MKKVTFWFLAGCFVGGIVLLFVAGDETAKRQALLDSWKSRCQQAGGWWAYEHNGWQSDRYVCRDSRYKAMDLPEMEY